MKKLILILALSCAALVARAQTTTNITVRWTVETVIAGVTNTDATTLRMDYQVKKDATRIDGLNFAYAAAMGTNAPTAFGPWLRSNYLQLVSSYAQQKQQADNVVLLQKLTSLLTANMDLLTASDLSNLATIAAKAP